MAANIWLYFHAAIEDCADQLVAAVDLFKLSSWTLKLASRKTWNEQEASCILQRYRLMCPA